MSGFVQWVAALGFSFKSFEVLRECLPQLPPLMDYTSVLLILPVLIILNYLPFSCPLYKHHCLW